MISRLLFLMVLTCLAAACASHGSVLYVAPQGNFKPSSEAELLGEIYSQMPFKIPPRNIVSKQKPSGLVGWIVVRNEE